MTDPLVDCVARGEAFRQAQRDAVMAAHLAYGHGAVHSVGARMVGGFAETQARAATLDASWSSLAFDAARCPAMAPTTALGSAFDTDLAAWKVFLAHIPFVGGDDLLDTWQTRLSAWQDRAAAAGCKVSGIKVNPPPPPTPPSAFTTPILVAGAGIGLLGLALLLRR